MKKAKQNNIVKFPNTISDVEKEIEAVLFASSEPLTAESILEKITKKNTNVLKCLEKIQSFYSNRGINLVCISNRIGYVGQKRTTA